MIIKCSPVCARSGCINCSLAMKHAKEMAEYLKKQTFVEGKKAEDIMFAINSLEKEVYAKNEVIIYYKDVLRKRGIELAKENSVPQFVISSEVTFGDYGC